MPIVDLIGLGGVGWTHIRSVDDPPKVSAGHLNMDSGLPFVVRGVICPVIDMGDAIGPEGHWIDNRGVLSGACRLVIVKSLQALARFMSCWRSRVDTMQHIDWVVLCMWRRNYPK